MRNKHEKQFTQELMDALIQLALKEDIVDEDVTTNGLIAFDRKVTATVTAKEEGFISGTEVFTAVFHAVDPNVEINILKGNGCKVAKGVDVIQIQGMESSILKAERTALNFLQRLSGIATLTGKFVLQLKPFSTTLLDTRKTTPGMRYLEKKAVLDGGGTNHRMNLEDMAMIKDNHVKMAGGITNAVKAIKGKFPGKKIEVEVRNLKELDEAISADVYMIMLDNFSPQMQKEAVKQNMGRINGRPGHRVKLEVSGNVDLENIHLKAAEGIDFISVGALTHSFKSMDLSLNIDD